MTLSDDLHLRELHSRRGHGISVRLLWSEVTGHVYVTVADQVSGGNFVLPVRQGERPLDVFNHPYAYAA